MLQTSEKQIVINIFFIFEKKKTKTYRFRHNLMPTVCPTSKKRIFVPSSFVSMDEKTKLLGKICAHILFCAIVIVFFGRNCTLRFAACGALYKEFIVAILPLAVFYITMFILFPRLLQRNHKFWYVLAVIVCSLSAAALELLFVAPQLVPAIEGILGKEFVLPSFLNYLFLITLRDLGFASVSHIICEGHLQKIMRDKYEARLSAVAHEVDESSVSSTSDFFKTDDILFCQQARNITWIHLDNGRIISRYGSLKKLAVLLGTSNLVYVSRSLLVMRDKIISYDNQHVIIRCSNNKQRKFVWAPSFYEKEIEKMGEDLDRGQNTQQSKTAVDETRRSKEVLPKFVKENRKIWIVYKYVARHPHCKATEIKKKTAVSQTTINRILARLKQEGLIEYQGSKKKGGYVVMEKTELGVDK